MERTWPLSRYHAMKAHWRAHGPPAHVSLAALAGFRPPVGDEERIADPEHVLVRLKAMGLLS